MQACLIAEAPSWSGLTGEAQVPLRALSKLENTISPQSEEERWRPTSHLEPWSRVSLRTLIGDTRTLKICHMSCVKGIRKVERMGSDSLVGHFAAGGRMVHHAVGAESMRSALRGLSSQKGSSSSLGDLHGHTELRGVCKLAHHSSLSCHYFFLPVIAVAGARCFWQLCRAYVKLGI